MKEERRRSKLEKDLKTVKSDLETSKMEETHLHSEIAKNEATQSQLRQQLREYKVKEHCENQTKKSN